VDTSNDRLRELVDLIVGSLGEDVNGEDIAARGYLSRYHFDRLVAAAIHESPGAFRRRLLLERAAWELGRSSNSVTWIALRSGFRSVEGFSRAFRRSHGVLPTQFRAAAREHPSGKAGYRLPSRNGIHFMPRGRITMPNLIPRRVSMDVVDRFTGHELWFADRLLDRAADLPEGSLDKPVLKDMPLLFGSHPITLRELLADIVDNKQMWVASMTGHAEPEPLDDDDSLSGLKKRLGAYGSEFERLVKHARDTGSWDDGFVDATCRPPEAFTYGGMLNHVMTFSAYRRTLAILAFRELDIDDLGIGDPVEWERTLVA
jgi:AraC family transcriptional regulator